MKFWKTRDKEKVLKSLCGLNKTGSHGKKYVAFQMTGWLRSNLGAGRRGGGGRAFRVLRENAFAGLCCPLENSLWEKGSVSEMARTLSSHSHLSPKARAPGSPWGGPQQQGAVRSLVLSRKSIEQPGVPGVRGWVNVGMKFQVEK